MAGGNTPGGFKIPVASSSYHEKCIASSVKALQASLNAASSDQTYSLMAYRNCNQVAQEKIWTENVHKESSAARRWKTNWGFITEYDSKGKLRQTKELPKEVKYYNDKIPTTTTKQYGLHLNSPSGHKISQLERLTSYRKRKSDLEENYT